MENKTCNYCNQSLDCKYFSKQSRMCRGCKNLKQRQYRSQNSNSSTKRYEKTKSGYIMRTYRNMLSRVSGIVKPHIYEGLDILSKEEFYNWALSETSEFHKLFEKYEESNYDQKLAPSVDRKDSTGGYTLDNIRWLTHSENSRLGAISRGGK